MVAPGSKNGVISGHHYNCSMRAHKLMCESLQCTRVNTFLDSLPPVERDECLDFINEIKCAFPERTMDLMGANEKIDKMCSNYADFVHKAHCLPSGVHASTWCKYSTWSNGQLHLSTVSLMMAWFFAYDRVNYARYLPSY
jgi:hypothetical protein